MNSPSAPLVGKYLRGGPRAPLRNFGPVERRLPMGDASVREDLGQYQTNTTKARLASSYTPEFLRRVSICECFATRLAGFNDESLVIMHSWLGTDCAMYEDYVLSSRSRLCRSLEVPDQKGKRLVMET